MKRIVNTEKVVSWISKGFSHEERTTPTTIDNSLLQSTDWYKYSKLSLIFKETCKKKKNATYTLPNRINFFIVYELEAWSQDLNYAFTLADCLFGGVKLAKNADPDKHIYTGNGIAFDLHSEFAFTGGSMGKNAIIFAVNMSSSGHIDNKKKDTLILGFGPTQELDDTT